VRLIADAEQQDIRCSSRRHDAEIVRTEGGLGVDVEFQGKPRETAFNDAAANHRIEKDDGLRAVQVLAEDGDRKFHARRPALRVDRSERREPSFDFVGRAGFVDSGERGGKAQKVTGEPHGLQCIRRRQMR